MLRDGYNVQFEGTIVQTTREPTLLRDDGIQRDQGWSWIVLFAAFLTLFITNGMHASFGILYAALISHFGSGREETAWIGSISLGLLCFFSPVASVMIEQIGCRATSIIGAFLCSLGFLITSFATGVALLYFSHGLLFGLGTSLTYTAAMTVVARSFERRRNIATGFCTSGSQFGGISLAPLSQVLFDRLGYAVTFRIFSALLLVVAISSLVYRSELGGNTSRPTSAKKSPKEMLNVWKSKAYIVWALGTTMVTLGYNIPRYTLAKYASDQGISKDASAWLVSYLCASSAIGRITFGRLCEWVPKLYLCQACIIGCAFSAFLYPFLKSYLALVITAIIFGLPDGGFVASLSMVTTEIVGPEKMVEGFGFMLFCQSYSNVMGPPLSGMLYDTYKSYKAAFCFAAVPEIIGFLMLFLIPYYRRNQVKYTHEIEYISNSGILNANGGASTLNPISEAPILPVEEPHGEYNVMINLTSDSPDVRLVNVIVQKAGGNETTGVSCNENETDEDSHDGGIVNKTVEEVEIPVCAREMPVCTSSLVTESAVEQSETRTASGVLGNESTEVNILSALYPVKTSSTQTVIHESSTEVNYPNNSRHTMNENIPAALTSVTASSCENESQIIDVEISAPAVETVANQQLVDIVSNEALANEGRNNHETTDIVDLGLQIKTSNVSLQLEASASIIRIASNAISLSDEHENPVEEIVHLHDQDVPKISPPPPHKHHVNNRNAEVHHVVSADVNTGCQGNVLNNSPEAILAELDTLVKEKEPQTNASLTTPFMADVNNQQASLIKSTGLEAGLTGLEVGLAAFGEPALNQNPESLMLSTTFIPEMTSPCLSTAFPTEPSHISGMNDILTQKQLPEPLKPTSLSSVKENEHQCNDTQEVPPATSPLSCELSTVIADVIQSLTSQQSASQKSTKESTVSSNMTDNPHENIESTDGLEKKQATVVEKATAKEPQLDMDIEPTMTTNSKLSSYIKLQTSVLHSMQSIVAEGCPEDIALLEDISIDLTLDKDPSFASIVVIDDVDDHCTDVNFPCLSDEQEKTKIDNDPVHDQSMTSTAVANQQTPGSTSIQFSYEEQGFLGVVNETAIDTPTSTQNFAGVISNPDQLSSIVLSNEILEESSSIHPNMVQTEIFPCVGNGFNSQSSINPGTISAQPSELPHDLLSVVSTERTHQPTRTHSSVNPPQASGISVHAQHNEQNLSPGLVYEQTVTSNIVSHQPPREVTTTHPNVISTQGQSSFTAGQEATTTSNQDQRVAMLTQEPEITPSSVASKQHESSHDLINTQRSVVLTQELQFPNVAQDSIATHTVIPTPKQPFPSVGIDQNVCSVTTNMVNQAEAVLELFPSYNGTTYDGITSHEKLTRPIESTNPFYQDMINDTEH